METWKPVVGYEGKYEVSSAGIVRSVDRLINSVNGRTRRAKGRTLSPSVWGGYLLVRLSLGGNPKMHRVHRLVAEAYIPNPNNCPQVNHIDGLKQNNTIENLEWVTAEENVAHAQNLGLGHLPKPVIQYMNGREVARHESLSKAAKSVGSCSGDIMHACNGVYRKWKGFEWRYAKDKAQ